MKEQARPDAFAGMTDGESRGVQRELSRERNKVAKSVRRGTTRGRLWLVRRRDQVEQK